MPRKPRAVEIDSSWEGRMVWYLPDEGAWLKAYPSETIHPLLRPDKAFLGYSSVSAAFPPEPDTLQSPRLGACVPSDSATLFSSGVSIWHCSVRLTTCFFQHPCDNSLPFNDAPQPLHEGAAAFAKVSLPEAEEDASNGLPGNAPLCSHC